MDDNISIKVNNLSKTFKLPHEKNNTIKAAVVNFYRRNKTFEKQKALEGISFEVKTGEFFGIIGRNGSGKSTLLKLLAGIYVPDSGSIQIKGSLTPFIELGVGFNMELTGRENVYLNGALLGFSRNEMNDMYGDIVGFAELERFMDQKLKNYSSGMQVRLAFSIAIRTNSDVLLLDEVLAVGDDNFQQKCLEVFRDYKRRKKTIILVTHSMEYIERFCDRALVIHDGVSQGIMSARDAVTAYKKMNIDTQEEVNLKNKAKTKRMGTRELTIDSIKINPKNPTSGNTVKVGETCELQISIKNNTDDNNFPFAVGLAFHDIDGVNLSGPNSIEEHFMVSAKKSVVTFTIGNPPFGAGKISITVGVFDEFGEKTYDYIEDAIYMNVVSNKPNTGKIIVEGIWQKK